uniref:Uncharacterized protein n=1 Tax=Arundo donax TaxID=35708 RepID=A0A0A8XMY9_ARUDO
MCRRVESSAAESRLRPRAREMRTSAAR